MIVLEGVEECFILLGRKDNVYPYLKQCDLYIQTSESEGYSTTILEARVLKRIVIATDINSNREQIISGETGYLVEHKESSFMNAIKSVITNQMLQKNIIKNLEKEEIGFLEEINKLKNF